MLYREKLDTKEKSKWKLPQEYRFTKDISFWYTISQLNLAVKPKVEVYVCKLPTIAQKKRTKQARGAKIKSAYTSTTKFDLEHISAWLEETAPYNVRIHDGVVQAFTGLKHSVEWIDLTLKSCWYLDLDVGKISENPWFDMERELFCSPVGALTLPAEEEDIQKEMQAFLDRKTAAEKKNYWTILGDLFDRNVRDQRIMYNPIRNYVEQVRAQHTEFQTVRGALAKKSFRLEEEQTLLRILDEQIPVNGGYLGIVIRYFAGLEPNIVCALTWGDIHKLDDGSHQVWVQRQVSNDGKTISGFSQVEDYRRLPISHMLYLRLNERRKYIKEQLSLTNVNDLSIVAPDGILLKGNASERLSPRALARLSRKVISEMGIPENVIYLPDKANGIKETNLSSYHGDIFRSHIRLRKSLTVQEECRIVETLFTDPMQSGQNMGLALMFSLGLRNGEACGVNFGAIREMESHSDCHCLWIYQSTGYSSNELRAGGKTANMPRILPIPQRLYDLLDVRRQCLETLLFNGGMYLDDVLGPRSVNDLPVACVDDRFTVRCQSSHLTKAGQMLLKEIQLSEDGLAYVDRDLQNPGLAREMGVAEKDPTVYLFWRNLGTHLYLLGLSESEIQYVMGH